MKKHLQSIARDLWLLSFFLSAVPAFAQTWNQTAKLAASDRNALSDGTQVKSTLYGASAVLYGEYMAATATGADSWAIFINKRIDGRWTQIKKISLSGPPRASSNLALDGDYLVITLVDGAYIYKKNQGGADNWGLLKKLTTSIPTGFPLALKGNYLVIGSPNDNTDANGANPIDKAGAALIFKKDAGGTDNWGEIKKITAVQRQLNDSFGANVTVSESNVVVSSIKSVTIFQRDRNGADQWGAVQTIAVTPASQVSLSPTLDMTENTLVVGLPQETAVIENRSFPGAGIVRVYTKENSTTENWSLTSTLQNPRSSESDNFGHAVAIEGNDIVASNQEDSFYDIQSFKKNNNNTWSFFQRVDSRNQTSLGLNLDLNQGRLLATASSERYFLYEEVQSVGSLNLYYKNSGGAWALDQKVLIQRPPLDNVFGSSVAVSGNYALIGSYNEDEDAGGNNYERSAGAAYLMRYNGSTWSPVKKLVGIPRNRDDKFGFSVAIYDTIAVVGVPYEGHRFNYGSVYIYYKNQGGPDNWGLANRILPSTGTSTEVQFGYSVFINEKYLAVSALRGTARNGQSEQVGAAGTVHLFEKGPQGTTTWNLVKNIYSSTPEFHDHFGSSVSMSGDYLLVGANGEDEDISEKNTLDASGMAYLFGKNVGGNNNWGQIKKIVNTVRTSGDNFGQVVAMSGDYALITGIKAPGTAMILKKDQGGAGNWGMVKVLTRPADTPLDYFGFSAALDGDNAVIGAYGVSGKAFVYNKNAGGADNWGQTQVLTPSDLSPDDNFGLAVAISGNRILIGSPGDDEDENGQNQLVNSGSAYVFESSGPGPEVSLVRINSGGGAITTSGNREFQADGFFSGTSKVSTIASGDILNTIDDALYRDARVGSAFSYEVPVQDGTYTVTLHFTETFWGVPGRGGSTGTNKRRFNVEMEGDRKLTNYDIVAAAGGPMRARQEIFVVDVQDGSLDIDFLAGAADNPLISAIEIIPGALPQVILGPVADAFVQAGDANTNVNFGSATTLEVKKSQLPSYNRISYLKFNLSSSTQTGTAKLRIFGSNIQDAEPVVLTVASVGDDSWTESGVTYSAQPKYSSFTDITLGTVTVTNEARYYELDVSGFVNDQLLKDRIVTFKLYDYSGANRQLVFNSRENAAFQPQLVITSTGNGFSARTAASSPAEFNAETSDAFSKKIYPNPARKQFSIQVSDQHKGEISFDIISVTGKNIRLKPENPAVPGANVRFDVSTLNVSPGIYVVRSQSAAHQETGRVLLLE